MATKLASVKSADPTHAALPIQLTSFVGREKELNHLRLKFPGNRLLTLTGTGGCGKTRLALRLATDVAENFPGGVWFIDLLPLTDSSLVPQKVMASLKLREENGREAVETIGAYFGDRRTLMILDNCEHLIDGVAPFVDRLLRESAGLAVLATSREVLHIDGEAVWPVPPLAAPAAGAVPIEQLNAWDAIQLFTERAASAHPTFTVTPANSRAIAQICRQLDGLPLAIELAAARTALMSPTQLLERLATGMNVLSRGPRSSSPKQQALEATFDWSYELLPERERTLFRRLGVFWSPFSLDEVEAVCVGDGLLASEVLDLLGQLCDKSLVVRPDQRGEVVRYRLLETVQRYARSLLQSHGEDASLEQQLADFCVSIAEQATANFHGSDAMTWIELIEDHGDNLRAVLDRSRLTNPSLGLRLSATLGAYWDLRGHLTEGRRWLATFLDLCPEPGSIRGEALISAALLAWRQGDGRAAQNRYEEALGIARSIQSSDLTARALLGLSDCAFNAGEYERAEALTRESLGIFRRLRSDADVAQALSRLGNVILQIDAASSVASYEESLALYRELGDRVGIANQLWSLGVAYLVSGQYAIAKTFIDKSLTARRRLGDELGIAWTVFSLGIINVLQGQLDQARIQLRDSLQKLRLLGDRWGISGAFDFASGVAIAEGKYADGFRFRGMAVATREAIGAKPWGWHKLIIERWQARARRGLSRDAAELAYQQGSQTEFDEAVEEVLAFLAPSPAATHAPLSAREFQIAKLVAEGKTNRQIGAALFISERTVDNHVKHILDKLGFRSRAQVGGWLR